MKKYLLGIMALALAIGTNAFTSVKKSTPAQLAVAQRHFTGTPGQEFDASKYDTDVSEECEGNSAVPCVINYDDSKGTLQQYLDWAEINGLSIETRRP